MAPPFADPNVAAAFDRHAPALRAALLQLREIVFAVAQTTPGSGRLVETLKWGQPAYLTEKPKSGTTVRIGADTGNGGDYALYVPCSTSLVADWRERYPELSYGGTCSLYFRLGAPLPEAALRHCIALALTYHRRQR